MNSTERFYIQTRKKHGFIAHNWIVKYHKLAGNDSVLHIKVNWSLESETITTVVVCLCQNAYVNTALDTRNLVEVLVYILVVDVQDTAPIFSMAPAVTTISNTLELVRYLFIHILTSSWALKEHQICMYLRII